MVNEGLKQVDQDLAKQIKQQGASGPIDCALLGRKVSQAECASEQIMRRPLTAEERGPAPGGWPKGKRRMPLAAEPEDAADLDVATSHAEPGSIAEDVLAATREFVVEPGKVMPMPVLPSEIPLEDLLYMVRNRLPGMTVEIRVGW